MSSQNEIREQITNTIIAALQLGNLPPWRMPWRSDPNAGFPTNVASGKTYRGINPLLLQVAARKYGFTSKLWGTYRQWSLLGGQVKRRPDDVEPGQWGTSIIFFKPVTVKDDDDDEKSILVMRTYVVFCIDQIIGDHLDRFRAGYSLENAADPIVTFEAADAAIASTGATIIHGGNRAFYRRSDDSIYIPMRDQFNNGEYYETVCHELVHWGETRLGWIRTNDNYALGELVAEMGACFIAAELGLPTADNLENHAAYLKSWLEAMKNDRNFIFQAAAQASKATDYILSFSRVKESEEILA